MLNILKNNQNKQKTMGNKIFKVKDFEFWKGTLRLYALRTAPEFQLTLEYLSNKIDAINKRFRDFENLVYSWKKRDMKDIDEIKKRLEELGK